MANEYETAGSVRESFCQSGEPLLPHRVHQCLQCQVSIIVESAADIVGGSGIHSLLGRELACSHNANLLLRLVLSTDLP